MKLARIYDWILNVFTAIAGVIVVYAWLATCIEVFMRQVLNSPTDWTVETTEYALLFITFLGAAWVLKSESHIVLDVVPNMLSPRHRALLVAVVSAIGAMVCFVFAFVSSQSTFVIFQRGARVESILAPPEVLILAVIPLGCFLLCIQFAILGNRHLKTWKSLRITKKAHEQEVS